MIWSSAKIFTYKNVSDAEVIIYENKWHLNENRIIFKLRYNGRNIDEVVPFYSNDVVANVSNDIVHIYLIIEPI